MPTTHVIADLVRQQTTTTGTGTLSLGTVPAGCRGVVAGIGDGKKARYKLSASDGGWETGLGTVTDASPDTFSRDVVYASSAGGTTKITLPAGTHTLDVTLDAKSANEMTPRLLGIGNGVTLSSGTLTVDCQGSCDALAVVVLTGNVTAVVMNNLPERATVELWVTHSGGPWTFPQNAWPAGTTLHGSYNLYTDGTNTRFWWTTADSGATSILECNAPASGGVTNGDAHDHSGGDGGQIAYSSLSGLPTLGSAAALNVGTAAGTVAAGNDSRFIPQATAQYKILVRSTAGAGAWEELASSANAFSFLQAATFAAMVDTLGGASSTGSGGIARQTSPTFITPTLGTPVSGTLTNCSGLPVSGLVASTSAAIGVGSIELGHASDTTLTRSAAGVAAVEGVALGRVIASGTAALGTSAIASGASATVVTVAATGVATTDTISWGFNANPNAVTGYNAANTTGCLAITAYPTAGNVNFVVSNSTGASITPGALTLNWRVVR